MRTIISGSRSITDYNLLCQVMEEISWMPTVIISGHCPEGVDVLGERWGKEFGIPVKLYPADWKRYGKKAGMLRNIEMAQIAQACVCLWDGMSPGTLNMIETAQGYGLKLHVHRLQKTVK